jgi:hypothetical protein
LFDQKYKALTEAMHDENLAVLRRNEFDIVVEEFYIPVSQHTIFIISYIVSRALGSQKKDYKAITEAMHNENLVVLRRSKFDIVVKDFGLPISQHTLY